MSTKKHDVPHALLASLLADYKKQEDQIGDSGLLKQLTKLLREGARCRTGRPLGTWQARARGQAGRQDPVVRYVAGLLYSNYREHPLRRRSRHDRTRIARRAPTSPKA